MGTAHPPGQPEAVRLLVVQHEEQAGIARFGDWLMEAGADLTVLRPYRAHDASRTRRASESGDISEAAQEQEARAFSEAERSLASGDPQVLVELMADFDGLIVLGGSPGPWDDAENPWFPTVRHALAASARGAFPSFNICLGAELLCAAIGGDIVRRSIPQVGISQAVVTPSAMADPVFQVLPEEVPVPLWHQDEMAIDAIDQGVAPTLLLTGTDSPVQAFRVGACAWGTQFHPESTGEQFAQWGENFAHQGKDTTTWGGKELDTIVQETCLADESLVQNFRPLAEAFVRYVVGFGEAGTG